MTIICYMFCAVAAFFAGWGGGMVIRRHAARLGLVQIPNARSSHSIPTPQGGGIAIALAAITAAILASMADSGFVAFVLLVTIIAVLGLADDILDLSPAVRFPIQGAVLAFLVGWAMPLPDVVLPFGLGVSGWALPVLVWFGALWWLNLFNFMDGIDGIAGTQAIAVLLGGLAIAFSSDPAFLSSPTALLVLMTSAATAGFLILNWAPARIFMGDAGSNTLAVIIFGFALITVQNELIGYPSWLILLSPFAADATTALFRRASRGERPWRAHRRHAYQQLARRWKHAPVTLLYSAFALAALPLAWAAQHNPVFAWWLVGFTYAPLIAFAFLGGSGDKAECN